MVLELITAKHLQKLANNKSNFHKAINEILSCCENVAKEGYYKTSFNNYKCELDDVEFYEVVKELESRGFRFGLITVNPFYRFESYNFTISWEVI